MTGLSRANGNFGGFKIANLTDQHNIRVMAQNRAQPGRERQPNLVTNLDLNGPFELIFDRIFEGDDLALLIIGLSQSGIKRGSLSAASRASQQNQPLGQ